ncbi:aspartate/glutamate/uridylate kinase [Advenella kashmirensis W13003]|uniref:Aspartate/glutamate/uridylate kinase n=1 Tax=Advenella kashmirensis W13003 TaxID=1424334 RepID=V8QL67_9BURK|nr:aspartate/glutamate/uridylate kinase [Advenella kashmirensis]ETF00402.1 aspartate/glutamate/uridylate kinase [Advenella kashmirensis W13003]
MWVVKLDGDLAHDSTLNLWLAQLGTLGGGRIIIVPGRWRGGDFIRDMKARWGFDNVVAHNMLVLSRAQYGLMLTALSPQLTPVVNASAVRDVLARGGVAVWVPLSLMRERPDELTSVYMSSDCIAAWLANHLKAERLVLVKSRPFFPSAGISQQIRDGVLNPQFEQYAKQIACPINLLHKSELSQFHDMLLNGDTADLSAGYPRDLQ